MSVIESSTVAVLASCTSGRLRKLCDLLKDQLRITRLNVEKKMARSWEETVADLEAQEEVTLNSVSIDIPPYV